MMRRVKLAQTCDSVLRKLLVAVGLGFVLVK